MTAALQNNESLADLFGEIYCDGHWGDSPDEEDTFFLGHGSRDPVLVMPFLFAVRSFLHGYSMHIVRRPDILDIGCGDFTVSARLVDLALLYLACGVVAPLIERNKKR